MCGIVGVGGALVARRPEEVDPALARAAGSLAHRGPDGTGLWRSNVHPIGLAHRRLAVIDLSSEADQPMRVGTAPTHAIAFNGEIYNHELLRKELEGRGIEFRTRSDTEVLLQSCRALGVEATLANVRGMFAFAYYDESDQTLWLARDRFGEKPLYYAIWNGTLAFASELRALRQFPDFPTDLDPVAIELLLRHSCIGGEHSIYRAARKVLPGTAQRIRLSEHLTSESIAVIRYWTPEREAAAADLDRFRGSIDDAADELDALLGQSVAASTVSDVPVGAFLSGGIDSTSVVSQLTRCATGTVRTFTIGFDSDYRSEADNARRIAQHLGTHHTDLTVTAQDALDVIPLLQGIYDEPFADSSQIPTYLVSQLARHEVTVALSGDGGDELFAGYPRFRLAAETWQRTGRIPAPLRRGAVHLLTAVPGPTWRRLGDAAARGRLRRYSGGLDERAAKSAAILSADGLDDVYRMFTTSFWERSALREPAPPTIWHLPDARTPVEQMMLRDTLTYLPDDILTKVDRAAMAVSLETRVPFLTPELLRFSYRLPLEYKLHRGEHKRVVRHLLARHVPKAMWDNPKRGFSVPIGSWLRGPLRPWAAELLSPNELDRAGIIDSGVVRSLWDEHQAGRRDWGSRLWNVLMFQAWIESTASS